MANYMAMAANLTLRMEFNKNAGIDKKDFVAIEFLLRKGRRQLEDYSDPAIKDCRPA